MAFDARQFARLVRHNDEQIRQQLADYQRQGWALVIEHTADPSPDNHYWSQWGVPLYDPEDPNFAMLEVNACRVAYPSHYIRINACEAGRGQALIRHTLLVNSPESHIDQPIAGPGNPPPAVTRQDRQGPTLQSHPVDPAPDNQSAQGHIGPAATPGHDPE